MRCRRSLWPAVAVAAALAACGSEGQGVQVRTPHRAPSGAAGRCAAAAGMDSVPAWHMGAIQFVSPASGIGITVQAFPCYRRGRSGTTVGFRRQAVRLGVSNDGGLRWRLTGPAIAIGRAPSGIGVEQVAARSRRDVWAVVGDGRLVATRNGGASWQRQDVVPPVVGLITGREGTVWAVSCPHAYGRTSPLACRPSLWRLSPRAPARPVALPRVIAQAQDYVDLAISPDGHMMLSVLPAGRAPAPEVLISSDTGRTWMTMRAPSWDHTPCTFGGSLATAAPHTFWLLCLGGAAAGSSTKGLLRTTDMGRTWSIMSAAPSLTRPPPPGAISLAEPSSLAAGSPTRLWLALTNGLTESDDAGRRWTAVGTVRNLGGWSSTLSVLNARHAWLLAAGAGLWRTTDGAHWQPVGGLNTN